MKNKILPVSIFVTSIIALLYNIFRFGFGSDTIYIVNYMPITPDHHTFAVYCFIYSGKQLFFTFLVCLIPMLIGGFIAKRKGLLTWKYVLTLLLVPMLLSRIYFFIFVSPRLGCSW